MKCALLVAICCIVTISANGCSHRRWASQWQRIPGRWRSGTTAPSPEAAASVTLTGSWGFRFGQLQATVSEDLDDVMVTTKPVSGVTEVFCLTGPDQCRGVYYYLAPHTIRVLLTLSRPALPELVYWGLYLRDDKNNVVAHLEPQATAFDLETGSYRPIPVRTWAKNCVAAEANVLADSEIARVFRDMKKGQINESTASIIQKDLAAYLATSAALCGPSADRPN
jgi:hypothetical protein